MDEHLVIGPERAQLTLARLHRYAGLRARHALPIVTSVVVGEEVRLTFRGVPAVVDLATLGREQLCEAMAWLSRLEADWGESLVHVSASEIHFDRDRQCFALSVALFSERGNAPFGPRRILELLGAGAVGEAPSVRATVEWLVLEQPELEVLVSGDVNARVRGLMAAAEAASADGRPDAAVKLLVSAWRLRPGDPEVRVRCVEAAAAATGDPGLPEGLVPAMDSGDRLDARLLKALVTLSERRGDLKAASVWARRLTIVAPMEPYGWRFLAREARDAGDRPELVRCLRGLARAGDEAALDALGRILPLEELGGVLDGWAHPWTIISATLRIRWLHHEDRLRELLQFYFALAERSAALDASALGLVIEAAERTPGRLQALRERLRGLLEAAGPVSELLNAYVEACLRDDVPEAIIAAAARWPGCVDPGAIAGACLAVHDYEGALAHATSADLRGLRLAALVRVALRDVTTADIDDLRTTCDGLRSAERGPALLVAELEGLRRVVPRAAITAQLERILQELE